MDTFCFNEELECHYCGYRFYMAGGQASRFPAFCPECGETKVHRAKRGFVDDEDVFPDQMEYDGFDTAIPISFD